MGARQDAVDLLVVDDQDPHRSVLAAYSSADPVRASWIAAALQHVGSRDRRRTVRGSGRAEVGGEMAATDSKGGAAARG
jgi:hypothetical protein